ncbi:MAG: hypothetical protein RL722_1349, partial [Pseudomonadota bacterium]
MMTAVPAFSSALSTLATGASGARGPARTTPARTTPVRRAGLALALALGVAGLAGNAAAVE